MSIYWRVTGDWAKHQEILSLMPWLLPIHNIECSEISSEKLEWTSDVSAKFFIKFASGDNLMCGGWVFAFAACFWSPISCQLEATICQSKQNPLPPFVSIFFFDLPSPALLRFRRSTKILQGPYLSGAKLLVIKYFTFLVPYLPYCSTATFTIRQRSVHWSLYKGWYWAVPL
jgi:hypothetical protein